MAAERRNYQRSDSASVLAHGNLLGKAALTGRLPRLPPASASLLEPRVKNNPKLFESAAEDSKIIPSRLYVLLCILLYIRTAADLSSSSRLSRFLFFLFTRLLEKYCIHSYSLIPLPPPPRHTHTETRARISFP